MLDAVRPLASTAGRSSLPPEPDLEQVFAEYVDPVYRFLYRRLGNQQDAEDLTSEVFLKAVRQLDRSRPPASIAQWLFTVARTALADHWRRYYRGAPSIPLDDMQVSELQAEVNIASDRSRIQLVEDVLSRLPERYRRVLELRFLRGYSLQETAREMGVTLDNVKVIQHRALAKAVQLADGEL